MDKNFSDFLTQISLPDLSNGIAVMDFVSSHVTDGTVDREYREILATSLVMSVNLLKQYHEWLNASK